MSIEDLMDVAAEADQNVRYHEIIKAGQVVPQGDLYLHKIADIEDGRRELAKRLRKQWPDFRLGPVGKVTTNLQLVADVTPGARHCIDERDAGIVTIYAPSEDASPLEGPVLVASGRFLLVHPGHGSHSCPEGIYQCVYQRDHARELARVAD